MGLDVGSFEFEYVATDLAFGRGCVDGLAAALAERGLSRALVVCGTNVGANRAVMDPVEAGLGDRLAGVFDETTPGKAIETVLDGVERLRTLDADVVVAVGGGSSLNVARAMCAVAPLDLPRAEVVATAREAGAIPVPDEPTPPVPNVVVPTTMPGADLTTSGGIMVPASPDDPAVGASDRRSVRIGDPRLMAEVACYDPSLFETTPTRVLAASAMNGFDKGLETAYSRTATPPGVAHALHGLRYLHAGLPELLDAPPGDPAYDRAVLGLPLVQYGRQSNIVHTFGNGVSFHYDVQQGTVHGIVVPHVLRYVFDRVDAGRRLIAGALGVETAGRTDAAVADAVVEEVTAVRDALGLPARLRDVDGLARDHLPAVADEIAANHKHARNPPGIDPTADDVLEILHAAW